MPDRYALNADPALAALLHTVADAGWGNQSIGEDDPAGFHATLVIVEAAEQHELTEVFEQPVPVGNFIVTRHPTDLVTVDTFATSSQARHAFDTLPDLLDGTPAPEDGTITPAGPPGTAIGYAVSLAGEFLGYAETLPKAAALLRTAMDAGRPAAWFVSHQGDVHRVQLPGP